ncbi:TERF1-interacting nuclear factor 2 [Oxyura jamaicensis]|uniref:TERF1-interacting nuclear factor 2 n=1 Tax=Oxyura jamaicensis TaxID=8884 RepID=UPI0015A56143|nr:TERF1-interacting nuclear factor 2 [Oxyura jamaicensis]
MGRSDVSPPLALRLALAGAWHVVRGRSLGQFPRVLRVMEAVGRAAPGAIGFRHGARLRLGLQAAVVVRMLQEAQPDGRILDAIDAFFPEGDGAAMAGHGQATPRDLALVEEAQDSFRELVLALLGDGRRRAAYLRGPAGRDYGEPFLQALESLFYEFLQRLESALPPPRPLPAAGSGVEPIGPRAPPPRAANPQPVPAGHGPRPPRLLAPPPEVELPPAGARPLLRLQACQAPPRPAQAPPPRGAIGVCR